MEAGRELDALIAESVFGWKKFHKRWQSGGHSGVLDAWLDKEGYEIDRAPAEQLPRYSTDIAAAWEVVEKITPVWRGFTFLLDWCGYTDDWRAGWFEWGHEGPEGRAYANAPTPAHAICLAALKALPEQGEK